MYNIIIGALSFDEHRFFGLTNLNVNAKRMHQLFYCLLEK